MDYLSLLRSENNGVAQYTGFEPPEDSTTTAPTSVDVSTYLKAPDSEVTQGVDLSAPAVTNKVDLSAPINQPYGGEQQPTQAIDNVDSNLSIKAGNYLNFNEPYIKFDETTADTIPTHLLKAELGADERRYNRVAVKLHGRNLNTIGYGLDIKYDPNNLRYLKLAGVSDDTIKRLKAKDKSARITIKQAKTASDYAYKAKYKQIARRLKNGGMDIETMNPKLKAMVVSLGYNGYLSPLRHTKNKRKKALYAFRGKIWDYVKANDAMGLGDFIKSSTYRNGVVKRRFERAGLL